MDLLVIILTLGLKEEVQPAKNLPKVCHKIKNKDKTMIEMVIENCLKLDPDKILIYVSKNNIQCINKIIKKREYSKLVSFYVYDVPLEQRTLSIGQKYFKDKNV